MVQGHNQYFSNLNAIFLSEMNGKSKITVISNLFSFSNSRFAGQQHNNQNELNKEVCNTCTEGLENAYDLTINIKKILIWDFFAGNINTMHTKCHRSAY